MTLFAVATFLNAALLFAVEPMFTRMVLPLLGGTPSVWNTCLLFYQGALLAGYLYAHVTSRWLAVRRQVMLHLGLLALALLLLPISLSSDLVPPTSGSWASIGWLLGLLTTSLGVPFVLLAAGTPMLQRWFAGTRHPQAANPYFLYMASNAGSFAALLAYPTLIEPRLALSAQSAAWAVAFGGLLALVALAGWWAWRWRGQWNDAGRAETVMEGVGGEGDVVVGGAPRRPPRAPPAPPPPAPPPPPPPGPPPPDCSSPPPPTPPPSTFPPSSPPTPGACAGSCSPSPRRRSCSA